MIICGIKFAAPGFFRYYNINLLKLSCISIATASGSSDHGSVLAQSERQLIDHVTI